MRKKILITCAVILMIVIIAIGISVFFILSNEEKPKTGMDFYGIMQGKGYVISDAKNQFMSYDYIREAYVASSNEYSYKIEFYVLSDKDYATKFFDNNKAFFEESKGEIEAETNINEGNHSKYEISANGKYSVVSKIENTAVYVNVSEEYKDIVKEVLVELGY